MMDTRNGDVLASGRVENHAAIDPVALLRKAGLRVTAPRIAVVRALDAHPHADAEAILEAVRDQLGAVSHQTVYGVLQALVEAGLVRRIEPAASPGLFELRVGDNHHHIVCRRCGATVDVDCLVGERPCLNPSETHGYLLDEAEITFWGLCPSCSGSPAPHEPSS
jgi:Fe2+ or Zn2+ uptake regulation protein